jgi:cell division septation protein DedD
MTIPSISRKVLLGISLLFLLAGGCKDREEPAPPEEPPAVRKRVEVPKPPSLQVVKPWDIEPAAPFGKEGPPKPKTPEAPTPKLAEVKPPVEEKAPTPKQPEPAPPAVEKAPAPKPAEVKPPVEKKAPTPEVAVAPKEVAEKPAKKAEVVADAKSERPSAPAVETPPAGTYTVTLASFKTKERADHYLDKLKKIGIDAYVWEVDLPEKGKWYRVSVGRFPTLEEAKNYKEELKQKGISNTYIVKVTE